VTKLTDADKHHWAPVPQVLAFLEAKFGGGKVLDVGPGHSPLPWATSSVDFVDVPGAVNQVKCDLTKEPLPFPDKSFDFVYCRHLLEDSWNPFPICEEMSRVGRAGYVETPSPVAEMCRGVDGSSPAYRGYHHHRFIIWEHMGELRFISKYPLVEYLSFNDASLVAALRQGPKYWNTYYLWTDRINVKHRQSPLDFDVGRDYGMVLSDAINKSVDATNAFWHQIPERVSIQSLPQSFAAAP